MTTATGTTAETRIAISAIQRPDNVRDLNAEHVESLAQSIKPRGLLLEPCRTRHNAPEPRPHHAPGQS